MPDKCAECGRSFTRRHPSQRFCSPSKAGRHKCKDAYHNRVRFRADEITPARRAYLNGRSSSGRGDGSFQYVGGFGPWDDHKDDR